MGRGNAAVSRYPSRRSTTAKRRTEERRDPGGATSEKFADTRNSRCPLVWNCQINSSCVKCTRVTRFRGFALAPSRDYPRANTISEVLRTATVSAFAHAFIAFQRFHSSSRRVLARRESARRGATRSALPLLYTIRQSRVIRLLESGSCAARLIILLSVQLAIL